MGQTLGEPRIGVRVAICAQACMLRHGGLASGKAPATLMFAVRHSCSAMSACRRAIMSLLLKWSGHAGPRPMQSSVRPSQVLWSLSHRSSAQGRVQSMTYCTVITAMHNQNMALVLGSTRLLGAAMDGIMICLILCCALIGIF